MKSIPLGHGLVALVDDEDYDRLVARKWRVVKSGEKYRYAITEATVNGRKVRTLMHRFLLGDPEGWLVDHRNGDGLDNRRSNLRPATRSQNAGNHHSRRGGSSRFCGVHYCKKKNRWVAMIQHQGKRIFLGRHEAEEDAAKAYDAAAVRLFGEFANLNLQPVKE